ncbi:MAG: AsmA family protein, partial [Terriglobales bacterium]
MTGPGRRRLWVTVAIVAALPLLLPLIALPGAKARVLNALRAGLGRTVEAQALHLHLYPVPGVELDQVRLGEDPEFGIEDMVVADSATASVRLLSLFGGRLAFSRIHLDGASINLVRNDRGEWNVTALLDRAAHGGSAPALRALTPAQRFPYLDWSDSRVNFKLGQTKQRFYLDQVEGSLARDSSGWRLQAQFQPGRTDLNLSNTGEVTLDGRWPAAAAGFHQRPFE